MQLIDGRAVYSATDLVGFLACEHLTNLERRRARRPRRRGPCATDPELDRIAAARVRSTRSGSSTGLERRPARDGDRSGHQRGRRWGRDLASGCAPMARRWRRCGAARTSSTRPRSSTAAGAGMRTSCVRVEVPSEFGPWSYEVWDTKLARHVKGSAVLQLCAVLRPAGRECRASCPGMMDVALGGSAPGWNGCASPTTRRTAGAAHAVRGSSWAAIGVYPPPSSSRIPSSTATSAAGWSSAMARRRATTTCRSWPASPAPAAPGCRVHAVTTRRSSAAWQLPVPACQGVVARVAYPGA